VSAPSQQTTDMGPYGLLRGAVGIVHLLGLYTSMFFMCNILPAISSLFVAPFWSQAHQVYPVFFRDPTRPG